MISKILSFFSKKNNFYTEEKLFFTEEYLNTLKDEIMKSSYLKKNNLNYNFSGTLGFTIVFKKGFEKDVIKRFPFFDKYLEKIYNDDFNVYYLNPLVMSSGSKIKKHVDHSLRSYYINVDLPKLVNVLYVHIPILEGGNLILYEEKKFIAKIKPEKNKLLKFKGTLKHEVTPVIIKKENEVRISLVCEQYSIDKDILTKIPDFLILSSAQFSDFLENEMEL